MLLSTLMPIRWKRKNFNSGGVLSGVSLGPPPYQGSSQFLTKPERMFIFQFNANRKGKNENSNETTLILLYLSIFSFGMSRFGLEEFSMKIIRQLISLFFETDKTKRTPLTPETREKFAAFWMMFPF